MDNLPEDLVTPQMRRAGADAMSEFDERFEERSDMVHKVFFAMLDAAPPEVLAELLIMTSVETASRQK